MVRSKRPKHTISMLLPAAEVAKIDRAARLRGRTRTEFVRDAAVRAAEEVITEQAPLRMSEAGFAEFKDILSRPAVIAPEMLEIFRRPAPWEPGYVAKP